MQPSSQQPTTDQRPQTNSPDHAVHTGDEPQAEQWRLYVQQQKRLHCPTCGESGGVIY